MAKTLIVAVRIGGSYEFTPEPNENLSWHVADNGSLHIRRSKTDADGFEWPPETFRVFAHGHWTDVEIVE